MHTCGTYKKSVEFNVPSGLSLLLRSCFGLKLPGFEEAGETSELAFGASVVGSASLYP